MNFLVTRRPKLRTLLQAADRARDARAWPEASLRYREAIMRAGDRADLWVQYGHALKESGYVVDAELAYRQAISRAPDMADTHLQLGHALKLLDRRAEAIRAYRDALRLDRHNHQAIDELMHLGVDLNTP